MNLVCIADCMASLRPFSQERIQYLFDERTVIYSVKDGKNRRSSIPKSDRYPGQSQPTRG